MSDVQFQGIANKGLAGAYTTICVFSSKEP